MRVLRAVVADSVLTSSNTSQPISELLDQFQQPFIGLAMQHEPMLPFRYLQDSVATSSLRGLAVTALKYTLHNQPSDIARGQAAETLQYTSSSTDHRGSVISE
jgi:hypothetical protein